MSVGKYELRVAEHSTRCGMWSQNPEVLSYCRINVVCDLAAMNEIRSDEYHHTESTALNMTDTILFFVFSATGLLKSF